MTEKTKAPAGTGIPTDANPNVQLHSNTAKAEIQALCGKISVGLSDVADKLIGVKVLLNDQSNLFFGRKDPVTEEEKTLLVYSFPTASTRQEVIFNLALEAAAGLADVLVRLDVGVREGRLPE